MLSTNKAIPPIGHAILTPQVEEHNKCSFNLKVAVPRRSPLLLAPGGRRRFDALQYDLNHGTVYFLRSNDYNEVYQGYFKGKKPGPDNICFTLPVEGLIVVRLPGNWGDVKDVTLSAPQRLRVVEALKRGVLDLRQVSEERANLALLDCNLGLIESHLFANPGDSSERQTDKQRKFSQRLDSFLQKLDEVERKACAKALKLLLLTLDRHAIEPLSDERLVHALAGVRAEVRHSTQNADATSMLKSLIKVVFAGCPDLTSKIDKHLILSMVDLDPAPQAVSVLRDEKLREGRSNAALARRPYIAVRYIKAAWQRVEQLLVRLGGAGTQGADSRDILREQHDRCLTSASLSQEVRKNSPIQIPETAQHTKPELRRTRQDPKGQYLQVRFDLFRYDFDIGEGLTTGQAEVRWHTRTQAARAENPGYRVTITQGNSTFELTNIKHYDPGTTYAPQQFVTVKINQQVWLARIQRDGKPEPLDRLETFGLVINKHDNKVYSRSERRTNNGDAYLEPVDSLGKPIKDTRHMGKDRLRSLWHITYVPKSMDTSD